jgi:hypothetical protein
MIRLSDARKGFKVWHEYADWAKLSPSGIIVKAIHIYADESGTHDKAGLQDGSRYPTLAGYAAPPRVWDDHVFQWSTILNSYDVPYFHFREWSAAYAAIKNKKPITKELAKNPFFKIGDVNKLKKLLLSLAKIAGAGNKVVVIASVNMAAYNRLNRTDNPFKLIISEFFNEAEREVIKHWGTKTSAFSFFFDSGNSKAWNITLAEVWEDYKAISKRELFKVDGPDTSPNFIGVQSADMLAYRIRQLSYQVAGDSLEFKALDDFLLKPIDRRPDFARPELDLFYRNTFK